MKNINTMNGKRFLLSATVMLIMLLMINPVANAQVGIGTDMPNEYSALDITDAAKGLLIPRVEKTVIETGGALDPAVLGATEKGLKVFVEAEEIMYLFDGTAWVNSNVRQVAKSFSGKDDIQTVTGTSVIGVWELFATTTKVETGHIAYNAADETTYDEEDGAYTEFVASQVQLEKTESVTYTDNLATTKENALACDGAGAASNAFDLDNGTFWSTGACSTPEQEVIEYDFGTGTIITKYTIKKADGLNVKYTPNSWTLEGWNGSWVEIAGAGMSDVSQADWTSNSIQTVTFSNVIAFTKYRLNFTASNDASGFVVDKIEMMSGATFEYQTTNGYHVTTTVDSDIDNVTSVNEVNVTETPNGQTILYLVSDDGNDWYTYNGAWNPIPLEDINFQANGMDKTTLEGITPLQWNELFSNETFHIAAYLKTADPTKTPLVSDIEVLYDTPDVGQYIKMDQSDYQISRPTVDGSQVISITKKTTNASNTIIDFIK